MIRISMFVLAGALAGCSPESYERSADLQVADILRDRSETTLGYQPEVAVETQVAIKPAKNAYERIPTSPIPPPTTSPIEPEQIVVPVEPLGPDLRWKDAPPEAGGYLDFDVIERQVNEAPTLGPPLPDSMQRRLDLFACLEYGVQHSRSYQDRMEDLYLTALDVTLQRHLFSPRPFVRQSFNAFGDRGPSDTGSENDVDYRTALTATTSIGIRQRLPYGGEIVASTLVDFVQALTGNVVEGESADVALTGSIPLLRGAGMVNLEPLIRSEREIVYRVRSFEDFRRSFVVDIASRYFNLLALQQGIANRRLSVVNLTLLTERTQALYEAGRINFLEVQRSLQSQLSAESALINAEEAYQTALDNFKVALGMPVDEPFDVVPVQLDVTVPDAKADKAVQTAHAFRLDLRTAADRIEDARRSVANARNGLLPSLDLSGEIRTGNSLESPARYLNEDEITYRAGLTLDLPVDRLSERNAYRSSLIGLQRSARAFEELKDRITADVRDSLRTIRSATTNLDIQRRGIELAQKRLEYSTALMLLGRIAARDAVESQASLLDAQDRYEQARASLQIRVLEYMRATGTLRVDPQAGAIGKAMDRDPATSVRSGQAMNVSGQERPTSNEAQTQ